MSKLQQQSLPQPPTDAVRGGQVKSPGAPKADTNKIQKPPPPPPASKRSA
jgi:hypothetical protein